MKRAAIDSQLSVVLKRQKRGISHKKPKTLNLASEIENKTNGTPVECDSLPEKMYYF